MAIKIIKHDTHEHTTKITKEEVCGLKIDTSNDDTISRAFGWSKEKFDTVWDTMRAFQEFQEAAERLNKDLPESTKISVLADFLKSDSFKKLGIKLVTPNDYFLLGCIWSALCVIPGKAIMNSRNALDGLLEMLRKDRG